MQSLGSVLDDVDFVVGRTAEFADRLVDPPNRERPRAEGGWSKIAAVERPNRRESRRRRPFRLNRESRLGTMAV